MNAPFSIAPTLLAGDVAVVTGAARGNGLAMAKALAAAGAAVALADVDGDEVSRVAREITEAGGRVTALRLDVTDRKACVAAAARIEAALGTVSVLVNNAGILRRGPMESERFGQDWEDIFRTNVDGCIYMMLALREQLCRTRGRIINIGSIASYTGAANAVARANLAVTRRVEGH